MEIKIKTAEEFHDQHVSLEIRAERSEVGGLVTSLFSREKVDGSLSMSPVEAANVLDQAERAGKVPALERRVRELENDRDDLRTRLGQATNQAAELRALVTQRDEALDQAADDLAASKAFRAQEREEARQQINRLADKLVAIRARVYRPDVADDLAFDADSEHYDFLVRVVQDVRQALDASTNPSDKSRELAHQRIGELERQLHRVRLAVQGLTLDQALDQVTDYVNHPLYPVRHMARRLRRVRSLVAIPEPAAEADSQA